MCEYCEGDIWDRKTIESDCEIEYTIGDKELLMAFWCQGPDGPECEMESEMKINYLYKVENIKTAEGIRERLGWL